MESYLYGWQVEQRGLIVMPEEEYPYPGLKDKANFINGALKEAMIKSDCGWDNLRYVILKNDSHYTEYMVLSKGNSERYYDVTASSKMSCLARLGDIIY